MREKEKKRLNKLREQQRKEFEKAKKEFEAKKKAMVRAGVVVWWLGLTLVCRCSRSVRKKPKVRCCRVA